MTTATKTFAEPQAYSDEKYEPISMTKVNSTQVGAIGYDAAKKTLAVSFARGAGAIYHYPNVDAKVHADFMAAESIGSFFGKHIKSLPFTKFKAPAAD